MKKIHKVILLLSLLSFLIINDNFFPKTIHAEENSNGEVHISYSSHCQKIGWQDSVTDGTLSGTTSRGLRLEAIKIRLSGVSGSVTYSSYVNGSGWQKSVSNGALTGTTGKSKELSAIKISLSGEVANSYDVYYQVHKSHSGWTGWVKNGNTCGGNNSYKIEGLQIILLPKGSDAPSKISFTSGMGVKYCAHVNKIGWQEYTNGSGVSGTTGFGNRIEAYKIKLASETANFGIEYSTYVENNGWQAYVKDDEIAGSTGQRKRTFGLKVRLTGYQSANYSVYYRTYITDTGWTSWVRDGEISGTPDQSTIIEAYQVRILKKTHSAPENTIPITSLSSISLSYSTHVQSFGWMDSVGNGEMSGTSGLSKRLEAIKISFSGIVEKELGIKYSTHVQTYGWLDYVSNGELSGTTGKSKRLEAIKIELTGNRAEEFDVYYRVHIQTYGWLGWAKNGEVAGSTGLGKRLEAIEIQIVPKNSTPPGSTSIPCVSAVIKGIDVSHHNGEIDWSKVKADGYSFAMVKVANGDEPAKNYKPQLEGACNSGLLVGGYCYSYAMSVEQAKIEAQVTLDAIKGYKLTYPIAFDLENQTAPFNQTTLSKKTLTDMILAYKEIIEDAGYSFVLYINKSWLEDRVDYDRLNKAGVKVWLARYMNIERGEYAFAGDGIDYSKIKFPSTMVVMWQHSETGKVNGITGNVDLNVSYGVLN